LTAPLANEKIKEEYGAAVFQKVDAPHSLVPQNIYFSKYSMAKKKRKAAPKKKKAAKRKKKR
jgi:hypothetical protein